MFNFGSNEANLEAAIARFNLEAKVVGHRTGPVLVTYEVEPAPGLRANRLNLIADDLARIMRAESCRIATDNKKGLVLLEMARTDRSAVPFDPFGRVVSVRADGTIANLPLFLGADTEGNQFFVDLAEAPHLLLAGTTGSGKSMLLNSMILSLMQYTTPERCRFLMIDPKMLELNVYERSPFMYENTKVVTDPSEAIMMLRLVVRVMEDRYKTLAKAKVRNISEYHAIGGKDMPYIVVVVDEVADLMQTAGKVIESTTQRLAQLARAAGIHLIIATQRPSVDVITGVIKANFPSRIAMRVASKVDSRVILDAPGAEKLLGRGDALITLAGYTEPKRFHGPLVTDADIAKRVGAQ